ncbi:DUF6470 family protein [Psychrobacillus sp. FSL W7-1493]|uniref:DUF6470 family protein n=1 Tax=Psychrobacillus sp. FSL W7-1493 TaxID=2921552 RepID=UPI0030FA36B1
MNFPQLQIRTTDAKLGLNIVNANQTIKQPKATQHIEQPAAIVEIDTTRGIMRIDASQARRDIGLIGPLESASNFAAEGRKKAMQGIARRVREGNQMMDIAHNQNAIVSIAKQNTFPNKKPLGINFIPSIDSVKLDYEPAKLDINVQTQKPKISAQINKPIYDYTPGKVSGFMIQNPTIEIDFIV